MNNKERFEKEGLVVEATRGPDCTVQLEVTLSADSAARCHKQAVKFVNKRISIPGFRKGKVPDSTVLERYPAQIDQEFRELAIQEAFNEALSLSKITPIRRESIRRPELKKCSKEEGIEALFSFEVAPEIPEIDFSALDIPEVDLEPVSEESVEEVIDQVRRSYATYDEIESRPVEEGDFVDLTIHAQFEDGNRYPVVENRRFKVDEHMQKWLKALVLGMTVGEVKESHTAPDPTASEEEKNSYKQMPVDVKLEKLLVIRLPAFDEELAKRLGATTTDEVLSRIRSNLEHQAAHKREQKRVELLDEALLARYPIELPPSLVNEEKRERMKQKLNTLKSLKQSDEEIKGRQQEIEEQVEKETVRAIRLYFLQQQIAKQGNISLSSEEFNHLLAEEAAKNPTLYREKEDSEVMRRRINQLHSAALQRKIESYALSQIK